MRTDGEPFTDEMTAFLRDWEAGYLAALRVARKAAGYVV